MNAGQHMETKVKPYYETDLGKLYHGDCLEVMPEIKTVDLVLTDPPYGMHNNTDSGRFSGGSIYNRRKRGSIQGRFNGSIIGDDKKFNPSPFLKFNNVILWGSNHFGGLLPIGTTLVWIKKYDDAFGTFLSDAELAWMKGGCGVYCFRDISFRATTKNRMHPNQKPLPLIEWCVSLLKTNGVILDPFLGSGTTAIACERLNRKWIGIEIEEKYCEIAAKRIELERKQRKLF